MIALVGAGSIARAVAVGLAEPVLVCDAGSGRAAQLAEQVGGRSGALPQLLPDASLLVLCHPHSALEGVAAVAARKGMPLVSLLAHADLRTLARLFPNQPLARAMPSPAVASGRGVTVIAAEEGHRKFRDEVVHDMFLRCGAVFAVEEAQLPVAATLGSGLYGPVALLLEALVDAALAEGLPADVAGRIAAESFVSAATHLRDSGTDTFRARREAASPGGLTARALLALEQCGIRSVMAEFVAARTRDQGIPRIGAHASSEIHQD